MCYVYAIEAGDFWKFGIAENPVSRCAEIQTSNPAKCNLYNYGNYHYRESAILFEKLVHGYLYPYRERGEWFRKGSYPNMVANLLGDSNVLSMIIIQEIEFQIKLDECKDRKSALEEWALFWNRSFRDGEIGKYSSLPWVTHYFSYQCREMVSEQCLLFEREGLIKYSLEDVPEYRKETEQ